MKVKTLIAKLRKIAQKNPDAVVLGSGDEDAGAIYDVSYYEKCTEDELPYDGGGCTDRFLGKDIVVLKGEWN